MTSQMEIQLGKKGLNQEFMKDIEKRLEKYRNATVKVRVLKSARENREDIKKYAEEIQKFLGNKYTHRIIGFSIFLKKWRKSR